jgi:hypothetical protein
MNGLTVNICTRGRPQLLAQTIETYLSLATLPTTTVMISTDDDDPASVDVARRYIDRCAVSVEPREDSLGEKFNRALRIAPGAAYLFSSDYAHVTTLGYDARIMKAAALFPDGIGCVYTHMANLSFPVGQIITAGLAERLGYLYPAWFPYWFVDHWIDDIARSIDRIVHADVQFDVSRRAASTTGLRDVQFWQLFYGATRSLRHDAVMNIISDPDFDEPGWRKVAILRNLPLIDERSLILNGIVCTDSAAIEQSRGNGEPDERYLRIKARAVELLRKMDLAGADWLKS